MQNTNLSSARIEDAGVLSGDASNRLAVGTRLDDFEITGVIGAGGFGIVYLAFDHALQRVVAIKEYMPGAMAWREADGRVMLRAEHHRKAFQTGLESFINEARLLAQLDHPALVRVYRYWEQNNTGYMAMRHYEGRTLQDVVTREPAMVTGPWLRAVTEQLLAALDVLHRVNILHRDISPENIIILDSGAPVLLDFGAARKVIGDMTQALTVILKPGYAPVEQYADDADMKQGPWTDLYALCGVIYCAIGKKPPPTSIARMIKDPVVPLAAGGHPGFDPAFLAAIDRGMAVRPEERPQSAAELLALFDAAGPAGNPPAAAPPEMPANRDAKDPASGAAPAGTSGPQPTPARPSNGRRIIGRPQAFLAAVLLLAAGAGIFLLRGQGGTPPGIVTAAETAPSVSEVREDESPDEEGLAWTLLEKDPHPEASRFDNFLKRHPDGPHAAQAIAARDRLIAEAPPRAADDAPRQPGKPSAGDAGSTQRKTADKKVAEPAGLVALDVRPWATVYVDNQPVGVSPPLKQLRLDPGRHAIRLENPNFPPHATTLSATGSAPVALHYDFTRKDRK